MRSASVMRRSAQFAILRGSGAGGGLEAAAECRVIGKAAGMRDLGNGTGGLHEMHGFLDTELAVKLQQRNAEHLPEIALQLGTRNSDAARKRGEPKSTVDVLPQAAGDLCQTRIFRVTR